METIRSEGLASSESDPASGESNLVPERIYMPEEVKESADVKKLNSDLAHLTLKRDRLVYDLEKAVNMENDSFQNILEKEIAANERAQEAIKRELNMEEEKNSYSNKSSEK